MVTKKKRLWFVHTHTEYGNLIGADDTVFEEFFFHVDSSVTVGCAV